MILATAVTSSSSNISLNLFDSPLLTRPLPTFDSPLPTPPIGVSDLPPIEHGHRHFERPARPIMPVATPMPQVTRVPRPTAISTLDVSREPRPTTSLPGIVHESKPRETLDEQSSSYSSTLLTPRSYLPFVAKAQRSVTVYAIAYIDTVADPQAIDNLHNQLTCDLTIGSKWHGTSLAAFVYSTHVDEVVKLYESPRISLADCLTMMQCISASTCAPRFRQARLMKSGSGRVAQAMGLSL